MRFLHRHFGVKFNKFILTSCKEHLASGSVLVDDSDKNIEKWENNGGVGILFPQYWNKRACCVSDRLAVVRGCLNDLRIVNRAVWTKETEQDYQGMNGPDIQ
jgi:hypothetical protein